MRDADIRRFLNLGVLANFRREPDTRIVEELGILEGESRIDIAVVNGILHGFEIKSECDTLNRLPQQVMAYNRVFDKLTLVVSPKHLAASRQIVPAWWGILVLEKAKRCAPATLTELVPPTTNYTVEGFAVAQLLWREEAIALLKTLGASKKLLAKPRLFLWQALSEQLPLDELCQAVRAHLKVRRLWRSDRPL